MNSTQDDFNPTQDSNQDDNYSQDDFDFQGAPLFSNNNAGVTVYPQKDKNGNWYLRINLPLFDSPVNVFTNNNSHDGIDQAFGNLVEHFNQK